MKENLVVTDLDIDTMNFIIFLASFDLLVFRKPILNGTGLFTGKRRSVRLLNLRQWSIQNPVKREMECFANIVNI